jgi:hypothetical protein
MVVWGAKHSKAGLPVTDPVTGKQTIGYVANEKVGLKAIDTSQGVLDSLVKVRREMATTPPAYRNGPSLKSNTQSAITPRRWSAGRYLQKHGDDDGQGGGTEAVGRRWRGGTQAVDGQGQPGLLGQPQPRGALRQMRHRALKRRPRRR